MWTQCCGRGCVFSIAVCSMDSACLGFTQSLQTLPDDRESWLLQPDQQRHLVFQTTETTLWPLFSTVQSGKLSPSGPNHSRSGYRNFW